MSFIAILLNELTAVRSHDPTFVICQSLNRKCSPNVGHAALHPSSISQGHSQSGTESLKSGAPGRSPGIGDKLAGTAAALVGKAKKNPQKVTEGEMRRDEGKKGIQEAEAEGGHY